MPFGEDLYNGVGARDSALKYNSADDDVRQKFTGYQKDEETQLDFAEARMYENRHARFTAVDPLLASGKSANPQTFNRYVYVINNPILLTDPSGLCPIGECDLSHYGTVYYKNIKGRGTVYNDVKEDDTWDVFKGDTVFNRDDNKGFVRVTEFGWYHMSIDEVMDHIDKQMSEVTGDGSMGRDWNFFDYAGNTFTAMGKSGYNAVADFDNLFYSAVQAATFDNIETPRIERYQPSNQNEAASMIGTDLGLLAISAYSGRQLLSPKPFTPYRIADDKLITLYRGTSKADDIIDINSGILTSKATRSGIPKNQINMSGPRRVWHSFNSQYPRSQYISASSSQGKASNFGARLFEFNVRQGDVRKAWWNIFEREYLIEGGARIYNVKQIK